MSNRKASRVLLTFVLALAMTVPFLTLTRSASAAPPLPGAIFTTDVGCNGTNINIFESKDDVYLNGGPAHPGAAGLADGDYYVQVTEPNGNLLGTSVPSAAVHVENGEFDQCYQLSSIAPYADTSNPGGEYKVWISADPNFAESASKTDNFKVKAKPECPPGEDCGTQDNPILHVLKYYDANANGVRDGGEQLINNWKIRIQDGIDFIRFTPVVQILAPDDYRVTEFLPNETNWIPTESTFEDITLAFNDEKTVDFGNVCLGPGGGMTLGFWSNKNGQAFVGADDLALLVSLNLRNATGANFDPANYAALRTWLLSGNATNMAYMLSVQLSAMELNVFNGKVSGGAIVYAPGTNLTANNFVTITQLMTAANTELGTPGHENTTSGTPGAAFRAYQEALKNALDKANNNLNFVQGSPCPFTFPQ